MPISSEILRRYFSSVFVETGTFKGEGVQAALDAGFDCIYTVEVDPFCSGYCLRRFEDRAIRVHLHRGDSREFLRDFLPHLTTRATFWLDSHYCGAEGGQIDDVPLLAELALIREHLLRIHHILIDDVRLMGTPDLPVRFKEVRRALRRINPDYQMKLIDSPEFHKDILVATL